MKIIGRTESGFIVEMSLSEATNLAGENLSPNRWYNNEAGQYENVEFHVGKCWDRITALNKNKDELSRVCGQLRAMADLLEPIQPVVEKLTNQQTDELL